MDNSDLIKKRCNKAINIIDSIITNIKSSPLSKIKINLLCKEVEKTKLPYIQVIYALEDRYKDKALKLLYANASEIVYNIHNKPQNTVIEDAVIIRELVKDLI